MNQFAGNFSIKGNITVNLLEYDYIESFTKDGNKNIFFFGETNFKTSEEILEFLKERFEEILNYDISISTEDKIEVLSGEYEEGIYELASFEGEQVDFNEIKERFIDFAEVVSIREAEVSNKFGNRVIKVDFVY